VTGRLLLHRSGGGGVDGGNRGEHSRGMSGGGTKRGSVATARDRLAAAVGGRVTARRVPAGCCAGGGRCPGESRVARRCKTERPREFRLYTQTLAHTPVTNGTRAGESCELARAR